jgi:hypothetical protein
VLPRAEQLRLHDTQRGLIPETRPLGTLQPCQMDSQCQSMGRRQRADNARCCTYAAIGYGGHRVYVLPEKVLVVVMTAEMAERDMSQAPEELIGKWVLGR